MGVSWSERTTEQTRLDLNSQKETDGKKINLRVMDMYNFKQEAQYLLYDCLWAILKGKNTNMLTTYDTMNMSRTNWMFARGHVC